MPIHTNSGREFSMPERLGQCVRTCCLASVLLRPVLGAPYKGPWWTVKKPSVLHSAATSSE